MMSLILYLRITILLFCFPISDSISDGACERVIKAVTRSKCSLAFISVTTKTKGKGLKWGEKGEKGKKKRKAICHGKRKGTLPMGSVLLGIRSVSFSRMR